MKIDRLSPAKLRKSKKPESWKLRDTDEISLGPRSMRPIGQERAVEAMEFGLIVPGRGYNGFYSGFRRKLAEQFGEDPPAGYYVCKGSSDILCLPVPGFHRYLLRKGYPHTWLVTPGGHEWYNWKYYYAWALERIFK